MLTLGYLNNIIYQTVTVNMKSKSLSVTVTVNDDILQISTLDISIVS